MKGCEEDYRYDETDQTCIEKTKCGCDHGKGIMGNCKDNVKDCDRKGCDEGYHHDTEKREENGETVTRGVCLKNICTCPNGTPATATSHSVKNENNYVFMTSTGGGVSTRTFLSTNFLW